MDVKVIQFVHHSFDKKSFFDKTPAFCAELLTQYRFTGELQQMASDGSNIASVYQKSGLAIEADLIGSVEIVRDHRFSRCQRLWEGSGEGFAGGQVRYTIHNRYITRHLIWFYKPSEYHLAFKAERFRTTLELFSQRAISNQQKPGAGPLRKKRLNCQEQILMTLQGCKPCDFTNNKVTSSQTQFGSKGQIID